MLDSKDLLTILLIFGWYIYTYILSLLPVQSSKILNRVEGDKKSREGDTESRPKYAILMIIYVMNNPKPKRRNEKEGWANLPLEQTT